MKIGIMSMQRIINYGSFLQAYGLKKTLENMGHQVEFVDYEVGAPLVKTKRDNKCVQILNKGMNVAKMLSPSYREKRRTQIQMNRSFAEFYENFEKTYLPQLGITKERNFRPQLDALVIGSDEVFNCTQAGEAVGYSLQLFGKDHCADRLISYAASFGSTTLEKIDYYGIKQDIKTHLERFDFLSVRDKNSAEIVATLCGKEPVQNIDPVLLYDFPEVECINLDLKDYIVVYAYSGRISEDESKAIRQFARKTQKKIVSLGFQQSCCDICIQASPLEVLAYIKHADYVITDTFHGTVFSIKYQVPFATLIRDSNKQKLGDLLQRFGLEGRSVVELDDLEKIASNHLNQRAVHSLLCQYQQDAKAYLNMTLEK